MSIRMRVILIITFTNLLIIIFSMFAGIQFMSRNIDDAQKADMQIVADMADRYISNEIELLFMKASGTAKDLAMADETQWADILGTLNLRHPEFIGAAVFDVSQGRITASGEKPAPSDAMETTHITQALDGKKTLNTTYFYGNSKEPPDPGIPDVNDNFNAGDVVFYIPVSMPLLQDRIFVATIPGMYFHEKLIEFVIWETGHVYIIDPEGTLVSNPRPHWVYQRCNIPELAVKDSGFDSLADTAAIMARGETGIGYYTVFDVLRVCAYKPVSGSQDGWSLGTVAPLPESPFRNINSGLQIVGTIGFILGVIAAIIASSFIKKPFEKVEALKAESELNSHYKSQFLANMSHEMRTPLTSVIGLTELTLRTVQLDDETHNNLVKVYRAGETLLGLINDILDISKIEANKLELNNSEYDLPSTINDAITQSLLYIGEKPVELVLDITEDLPRRLYGDELRVKQLFNNLLSNAFKFTKEGTVELYVRCSRYDDDVCMTIRVSDTGIGIKPQDFDKLFTLYANMNEENKIQDSTRRTEGTGLGLSICKRISEMMGGDISVESEYGRGSVFTVTLKQGYVDDLQIGADVVESLKGFHYSIDKFNDNDKSRINLSYARVLVVDDNTANLDVAKGLLGLYGMKIDCVTGGQQAIDAIVSQKVIYNAIFMDHMMPEIDGIEAAAHIRNSGTDYARDIPIIALTANAIIGNEEMFLNNGFQAFLAKPIDMTELDAVLRKWVRNKDEERKLLDTAAEIKIAAPVSKEDIDIDIPGIDTVKMKQRYQNDPAIYVPLLRSFMENALVLADKLQYASDSTSEDFRINMHGLKGISANICAQGISDEAALLEELSKTGSPADIQNRKKALLESVTELSNNLQIWLNRYDSTIEKPVRKTPDLAILKRLRIGCDEFDIESIDKAMEELENTEYETGGELILWLKEKITDSRFKEISERLKAEE